MRLLLRLLEPCGVLVLKLMPIVASVAPSGDLTLEIVKHTKRCQHRVVVLIIPNDRILTISSSFLVIVHLGR